MSQPRRHDCLVQRRHLPPHARHGPRTSDRPDGVMFVANGDESDSPRVRVLCPTIREGDGQNWLPPVAPGTFWLARCIKTSKQTCKLMETNSFLPT
jgi:hypothetical protein